jgi:carboxyl-terminal processing protease
LTIAVLVAVLAGIFLGGFYMGRSKSRVVSFGSKQIALAQNDSTSTTKLDLNLYWEVWTALKNNFVDKTKVTDEKLFYGSLTGMAAAAGDPYTVFMDPTEAQQFSSDLAGIFSGIGAEVGMRNNVVTIIAPLDGTPAKKAGLRAGDKIYAIDGKSSADMTIDGAVKLIRGEKGTAVTLTIIRGTEKPKDYKITRDTITVKSVTTEMRSDGLMVIRISSFNNDTLSLFNAAVQQVLTKNPKGLILDLRNNPGGYLDTAVAIASEWVKEGTVVSEEGANNQRNEYPSNGSARLANIPTVVLVNGGSASASEILAGALRDYKKATLVGEKTFGKGSVQSLQDLSDGSALKITVAHWLTPAGDFINDKGIDPTINVTMTQVDFDKNLDPQMAKAVQLLTTKKK